MAQEAKTVDNVREQLLTATQAKADAENKGRSGKGTRIRVGQTRGKNPQVITWESFDEEQPTTLPATSDEFIKLAGVKDDKELVSYLIEGYNSLAYSAASDPIAEYVDMTWPEDMRKGFRLAVRAYSNNAKASIEDAVNLIKPGFAAAAEKLKPATV